MLQGVKRANWQALQLCRYHSHGQSHHLIPASFHLEYYTCRSSKFWHYSIAGATAAILLKLHANPVWRNEGLTSWGNNGLTRAVTCPAFSAPHIGFIAEVPISSLSLDAGLPRGADRQDRYTCPCTGSEHSSYKPSMRGQKCPFAQLQYEKPL